MRARIDDVKHCARNMSIEELTAWLDDRGGKFTPMTGAARRTLEEIIRVRKEVPWFIREKRGNYDA